MSVEAGLQRYETVNGLIKKQLEKKSRVTVKDVNGQRYIGCALDAGKTVEIHGTPGNDTACYLNGGKIIIHGNAQDIHMKEFERMKPVIVIGRSAGSFLGEYMAGGTIVLLGIGMERGEKLFGTHCASGMHGGRIFVRGAYPKENLSPNIQAAPLTAEDKKELAGYVKKYCRYFGADYGEIMAAPFKKLVPATARPYANLYTPN